MSNSTPSVTACVCVCVCVRACVRACVCVCADRVVLLGNHRDAIAYGALDPGSGTAVMLEVARAFSVLAKQGACHTSSPGPRHTHTAIGLLAEVLLYAHRNRRFIRDGSPGRPP